MYLDEFIAQLQVMRAQHGDLSVWVENGLPPMMVEVQDMYPPNSRPSDLPEKVAFVR